MHIYFVYISVLLGIQKRHTCTQTLTDRLRHVHRYRSGIRGHMRAVVMDLLRQYLKVEVQFQHGEVSLFQCSCVFLFCFIFFSFMQIKVKI